MNETVKGWPVRTVNIPDYNWGIDFFDPSVDELDKIEEARKAGNEEAIQVIVIGMIKRWDCTERGKTEILPIEPASFKKLPPIVRGMLIKGLIDHSSADPKEDTGSPPVTTSAPEVKSPETPPAL